MIRPNQMLYDATSIILPSPYLPFLDFTIQIFAFLSDDIGLLWTSIDTK